MSLELAHRLGITRSEKKDRAELLDGMDIDVVGVSLPGRAPEVAHAVGPAKPIPCFLFHGRVVGGCHQDEGARQLPVVVAKAG